MTDGAISTTVVAQYEAVPFQGQDDAIGYIDPDLSVEQIGARVMEQVRLAESCAKSATWAACNAGRLLIVAKSKIMHGDFTKWVIANCEISVRTAQAYMRIATRLSALDNEKAQRVACLPIRQALGVIAGHPNRSKSRPLNEDDRDYADDIDLINKLVPLGRDISTAVRMGCVAPPRAATRLRKHLQEALDALDKCLANSKNVRNEPQK